MADKEICMSVLDSKIKEKREEILRISQKLYQLKLRSQFDESKYYDDFVNMYNTLSKLQNGLDSLIELQYDYIVEFENA